MPEGPSIVILREQAARFAGRTVLRVSGNSTQDIARMQGRKVVAVRSWGKHFLLQFSGFALRIHFLLFGSYRINEGKDTPPRHEVLHRIRVHRESRVGALPARKLGELVTQAREYSWDFYHWKKAYVLKKHYQVHTKTTCPRDGTRLSYRKSLGKAGRRAFWCDTCQRLYEPGDKA